MVRTYLVRGLTAGLVAGLALGLFVAFLANPMIGAAEELAGGHHEADGATDHHEADSGGHADHGGEAGLVSTATTNVVGALSGVFWGLLLGVLAFGLVFYLLEPAIPGSPTVQSALVGIGGFVTVSAGPWLVQPPQPPGVEYALGTDVRLAVYVGTVVLSLGACLAAGYAYRRLRSAGRSRAILAAAMPLGLLVAVALALPVPAATQTLPAELVAAFRAQVVFGQAVVWTLLAAAHAWLLGRETDRDALDADCAAGAAVNPAV